MKCEECQRKLELGVDLIVVEKCVVGPNGIVPLGEKSCFCSEECLSNYFSNDGLTEISRRIP